MTIKDQIDIVKRIVSEETGVPIADMISDSRIEINAWVRQVAMWLCREVGHGVVVGRPFKRISLIYIGACFGNRDHKTVIHAIKAVNNAIDVGGVGSAVHQLRDRIMAEIQAIESATKDSHQKIVSIPVLKVA